MKCPYKKIRKLVREKEMIVEDQFDFGDCEEHKCMAYYQVGIFGSTKLNKKCKLLEDGKSIQMSGGIS